MRPQPAWDTLPRFKVQQEEVQVTFLNLRAHMNGGAQDMEAHVLVDGVSHLLRMPAHLARQVMEVSRGAPGVSSFTGTIWRKKEGRFNRLMLASAHIKADAGSIRVRFANPKNGRLVATLYYKTVGELHQVETEIKVPDPFRATDLKLKRDEFTLERLQPFLHGNLLVVGTGPCPWDRIPFALVPGYDEGYGCPCCHGLSHHLEVKYG